MPIPIIHSPAPEVRSPFKFYAIDGQWQFPVYGASGGVQFASACYLFHSHNGLMDGADMGIVRSGYSVRFNNAGLWAVISVTSGLRDGDLYAAMDEMDAIAERTGGKMACSLHGTAMPDAFTYPCRCFDPVTLGI